MEQAPQSFGQRGGSSGGSVVHEGPVLGRKVQVFLPSPHSGQGGGLPLWCDWEWVALCSGPEVLVAGGCADGVLCCWAASRSQTVQTVSTMGVQTPWFHTCHCVNLSKIQPFWSFFS